MQKKPKLARVTIDVPDETWAEAMRITGETDPRRVVEAALRWYIEYSGDKERPDA